MESEQATRVEHAWGWAGGGWMEIACSSSLHLPFSAYHSRLEKIRMARQSRMESRYSPSAQVTGRINRVA